MAIRSLLVSLLLCAIVCHASAQKKKVDCAAQKVLLDSAANNMTMLMNEKVMGYQTLEQFDDGYCIPFQGWFDVFNGYKTCLKSFPRTLFAFVGTNVRKMYKQFCKTPEKKLVAFNNLKCLNPSSKPFYNRISVQLKNFADYMTGLEDIDDVIPGLCCGYMNITQEYETMFEEECTRQGQPGSGKFQVDFVKSLLVDTVDMMCGKYQEPEDCSTPKLRALLDGMFKANSTTFWFKSPIIPVITLMERIDGKINID